MAVNRDIDRLLVQHAQVRLAQNDLGRSEQHIAEVGRYLSARVVGQGGLDAAEQYGHGVGVDAHRGPVQDVGDGSLDVRW